MDPLTHALTGATTAFVASGRKPGRRLLAVGAVAALLPDVDVFIRSASDPLLAIEHHRGMTHALIAIPLGGIIAALPFMARTDARERLALALAGIAAYGSHALLDAATTYGTQLFWPFSQMRVGLDIISIIDPLFTLVLLAGVVAAWAGRRTYVYVAIALALGWLVVGGVQRERAIAVQRQLAEVRGEARIRGEVFPTIGNRVVWRSIYESGGMLRIDRLRVPWSGEAGYAETDLVQRITVQSAPGEGEEPSRVGSDLARFSWFSNGWIARDRSDPSVIADARYSLRSDRFDPIWGIRFDAGGDRPTEWVDRSRKRDVASRDLWRTITGASVDFRPLASAAR